MHIILFFIALISNSVHGMHKLQMPELDAEESYWQVDSLDAEESYHCSINDALSDESSDYDAEESYQRTFPTLSLSKSSSSPNFNQSRVSAPKHQEDYYAESGLEEALEALEINADLSAEEDYNKASLAEEPYTIDFDAEEAYDQQTYTYEEYTNEANKSHNYDQTSNLSTSSNNRLHEAAVRDELDESYTTKTHSKNNANRLGESSSQNWLNYSPSELSQEAPTNQGGGYYYRDRFGNTQYHDHNDYIDYGGGLTVSSHLRPIVERRPSQQATPAAVAPPTPEPAPYYAPPPEQRRPDGGFYSCAAK